MHGNGISLAVIRSPTRTIASMNDVVITVRGEHETALPPERAVVHLSVTVEGRDRSTVVERIAALSAPVREDLAARQAAGELSEWSSQRVSVWAERPWHPEGKRLAPVHHATVEMTATFTDVTAMSMWAGDAAERDGVQISHVDWQLTPETRARVEQEVATAAVSVAVERATAYARALGRMDVAPLEIADVGLLSNPDAATKQSGAMMARMAFDGAPAGGGGGLQFQPQDLSVTAAVEARFSAR
jgi:uncharacterized protein YggE